MIIICNEHPLIHLNFENNPMEVNKNKNITLNFSLYELSQQYINMDTHFW